MIILVFFILVTTTLIFWPYMWKDAFLNKWSSVATIFSVIAIPLIYFILLNEKESDNIKKECEEKKRVSQILYDEMSKTFDSLNIGEKPINLYTVVVKDISITYLNEFFNSDMYESFKFSGKLSFLDYKLRQGIQNIFQEMKYHDMYLGKLIDIEDQIFLNYRDIYHTKDGHDIKDDYLEILFRYYKSLSKCERFLLEKIPIVLKNLKKESDILC